MKHIPAELLEDIVRRLVEVLHPERIILFGSHAYGKPNEMSDIDLLIVVSESDEPRHVSVNLRSILPKMTSRSSCELRVDIYT